MLACAFDPHGARRVTTCRVTFDGRSQTQKVPSNRQIGEAEYPGPDSDDIGGHGHVLFDRHSPTIAFPVAPIIDADQSGSWLIRSVTTKAIVSGLRAQGLDISDDGVDLFGTGHEFRHVGMSGRNPLGQRLLQVFDRIAQMQ